MRLRFSILILLTALITTLQANEHFLLPDQRSDLLHSLKSKIKRAKQITIITAYLHSKQLSKAIEKAISQGAELHLITTDLESAARYAKYRHTKVYVPRHIREDTLFTITLLLIDNSDLCIASLPFDEQYLKEQTGMVICTTDHEEITFATSLQKTYTERFEPYSR